MCCNGPVSENMSYLGFSSSKKLCIVDWRGTVWQLLSSCCVIVGCNGQEKSCCRNILHVVPGVDPVHASCIAQADYSQEVSLWNYYHVSRCKWRSFISERQYQLTEIIATWSHGHLHPIIFLHCWAEVVLRLCLVLLKGWCIWPSASSHQQLRTWPKKTRFCERIAKLLGDFQRLEKNLEFHHLIKHNRLKRDPKGIKPQNFT